MASLLDCLQVLFSTPTEQVQQVLRLGMCIRSSQLPKVLVDRILPQSTTHVAGMARCSLAQQAVLTSVQR